MRRWFGWVALVGLVACKKDVADVDTSPEEDPLTTTTETLSTANGVATVSIEVTEGIRSFFISGRSDKNAMVERVRNPDGDTVLDWQDWYGSNESLSQGVLPTFTHYVDFNWPVRAEDGPLAEGTWEVDLSLYSDNGYGTSGDIETTIQTLKDTDLDQGEVEVRIVYADGLDDDEEVVEAVETAVERWRDIWAEVDIELKDSFDSSDFDTTPGYIGQGDDEELLDLSAEGNDRDLTLIIVEDIGGDGYLFGQAGGIPGPLIEGANAAVAVSWLAHSGTDLEFDDDEMRLFGDTMAHEIGHYMGLFHPVEDGGNGTWQYFDALADTPQCSSWNSCENQLADNMMFPYPICSWTECAPQDDITDDQSGVLHRYSGTR